MTRNRWISSCDWQTLHHLTAKLQSLLAGFAISDDWDSLLLLNFRSKKAPVKLPSNSVCTWFDLTTEKWQPPPLYHIIKPPFCHLELCRSVTLLGPVVPPRFLIHVSVQPDFTALSFPRLWMLYDTVAWRGVRVLESSNAALQPAPLCCFTPCGGTEHRQDWYN